MTKDEGMTKPETASNSAFPHSAFRNWHSAFKATQPDEFRG